MFTVFATPYVVFVGRTDRCPGELPIGYLTPRTTNELERGPLLDFLPAYSGTHECWQAHMRTFMGEL